MTVQSYDYIITLIIESKLYTCPKYIKDNKSTYNLIKHISLYKISIILSNWQSSILVSNLNYNTINYLDLPLYNIK